MVGSRTQSDAEELNVRDIRRFLSQDALTAIWLEQLTEAEPDFDVVLPSVEDLPSVLLELAVPHEDISELVAIAPTLAQTPDIWWLLRQCSRSLERAMGEIDAPPTFPILRENTGALRRYFYVFVFLTLLSQVRAFHQARDIPEDVSRLTLTDLGRNMAVHRRRHGIGGFEHAPWLMLHFRGAIYQLGRLQFERTRLGNRTGNSITAAGLPYGPGDPTLSVHVPDYCGPLTPKACDESFARAAEFFARHFPQETYDLAVCHSWLLDEQLAEYLPGDSNIIRFQRRFHAAYQPDAADEQIMRFVLGRTTMSPDGVSPGTALERAIVDHLAAGRHWRGGAGWLQLQSAPASENERQAAPVVP
jgi:hypothetical protein